MTKYAFYKRFYLAVLYTGLIGTLLIYLYISHNLEERDQIRFTALSHEIGEQIFSSVNVITYGLGGANGVFASSRSVEYDEFAAYVRSRNLKSEFPGVYGFGFAEYVERKDLNRFLKLTRADHQPNFEVITSGDKPELFVTKYMQPEEPNRAAIGFDIGSERLRREAAERALVTGIPTLTKKTDLAPGLGEPFGIPLPQAGFQKRREN